MDLQVRSQSANRKSEDRKRPSWSSAVFAAALPFAFCALPFDLFFALVLPPCLPPAAALEH